MRLQPVSRAVGRGLVTTQPVSRHAHCSQPYYLSAVHHHCGFDADPLGYGSRQQSHRDLSMVIGCF